MVVPSGNTDFTQRGENPIVEPCVLLLLPAAPLTNLPENKKPIDLSSTSLFKSCASDFTCLQQYSDKLLSTSISFHLRFVLGWFMQ